MTPRLLMVIQLAVAAAGIAVIAVTWKSSSSAIGIGIGLVVVSLAIGGVRLSLLGSRAGAAALFVTCALLAVLTVLRVA